MGIRDKIRRLKRAAEGELESFELLDGSRFYYDPLSSELFMHLTDCLKAGSAHNWPPAPEVVRKLTEAKDVQSALERVRGGGGWNCLVYDEEILIKERRLQPRALVIERDPDTGEWDPRNPYEEGLEDLSSQAHESREDGR
jgi:hypothetical protein